MAVVKFTAYCQIFKSNLQLEGCSISGPLREALMDTRWRSPPGLGQRCLGGRHLHRVGNHRSRGRKEQTVHSGPLTLLCRWGWGGRPERPAGLLHPLLAGLPNQGRCPLQGFTQKPCSQGEWIFRVSCGFRIHQKLVRCSCASF